MSAPTVPTTPAPDSIQAAFDALDVSSLWTSNGQLLSVLMTMNLLWSAIFLSAIYTVMSAAMHYIPILARVPLVGTLTTIVWFFSNVLMAIAIYASGTSVVIKVFGSLFLILIFLSFTTFFWAFARSIMLFYTHRSWAVATHGPICISINGKMFSTDFIPPGILLYHHQGSVYYNGYNLGISSTSESEIKVYKHDQVTTYTIPARTTKSVNTEAFGESIKTSLYLPEPKPKTV